MAVETRKASKLPSPGPYLAEITNHLDPTYMGNLEVSLIKTVQSSVSLQEDTFTVRYLNPFYGVTSIRFQGNNSADFQDVQKSYGMWFVPPDVGTIVMVIFIDGDPNQGYWMGCVPDLYQNHMVPGIAASQETELTQEQLNRYNTKYLPVAEFLKGENAKGKTNPDSIKKPVHPFADRLVQQGLLLDTIRGVTSSSARREAPSQVFGISTPGPIDPNGKKAQIGYSTKQNIPVSRLGGSQFVMDDGDINGENELVRIRTRTGHQILLHNSQDLIYIANSKGTAWVELTSNGKLDIFATDSVSIHSEADFNLRADRDFNIEAGRNINMRALKNMEANVTGFYNFIVGDYAKISVKNDYDFTIGQTAKISVGQDLNIASGQDLILSANNTLNLTGHEGVAVGSGGEFTVDSNGNVILVGSQIHLNGMPAAAPLGPAEAELPPLLNTFTLPDRQVPWGWGDGHFYNTGTIKTIMQRVPTHEPWAQHENVNPSKFSASATDVTLGPSRSGSGIADSPNQGVQESANQPEVVPGTCDPKFAKDINLASSSAGIAAIKSACAKFNITNPYMVATILGVAGGESMWKLVSENFNYTAPRLLQVFPSVFKGDQALAQQYAGNPNNSLPEFLYGYNTAKGKGLGNTQPGDGKAFIGRGYIGLTGRGNYTKFSKLLYEKGLVSSADALLTNPEAVNDPNIAGAIVALYFLSHPRLKNLNQNPGPGYFEEGYAAVGFCTPDIHARKKGYYECFLGQLQGSTVSSGSNGIVTDSQGNPIKTGK